MRGKAPVHTVLVGGEPVLDNGRFTRVDREQVLDELARSLEAPLSPDEERRLGFSKQLVPHVKQFCDDFLPDPGRRFTFSARQATEPLEV
jgi:hypothetical protein